MDGIFSIVYHSYDYVLVLLEDYWDVNFSCIGGGQAQGGSQGIVKSLHTCFLNFLDGKKIF